MIRGFRDRHDVEVIHSWGMTESIRSGHVSCRTTGRRLRWNGSQDPPSVRRRPAASGLRLVEDDDRQPVPADGRSTGKLLVSGWWVAEGYLHDIPTRVDYDRTDARDRRCRPIDDRGRMTIRDREKDLIKSGGEWISSLELDRVIGDLREVRRGRGRPPGRSLGRAAGRLRGPRRRPDPSSRTSATPSPTASNAGRCRTS